MKIEAVIFDWGGTLSKYAEIELYDRWRLAAAHLSRATGRPEPELTAQLLAADLHYWEGVKTSQKTSTLQEILAAESRALGLDVSLAVIEETAQRHLDAWTPHIRHHADAADTLRTLRAFDVFLSEVSVPRGRDAAHSDRRGGCAPRRQPTS